VPLFGHAVHAPIRTVPKLLPRAEASHVRPRPLTIPTASAMST